MQMLGKTKVLSSSSFTQIINGLEDKVEYLEGKFFLALLLKIFIIVLKKN